MVNEAALADTLGVGRMPVREALARLVTDRFIEVIPRRGTVVTPVSLASVVHIFDAREAVEGGIAHVVARTAAAADVAHLRELVEEAERAREGTDAERFLHDDQLIHRTLVQMMDNPLVEDVAERLIAHNLRFWRAFFAARPALPGTMVSHAALLEAIEAHDGEAAARAMRDHIATSRRVLQASL